MTEVVKMIAKEWQKLTKHQKQKYKEAAKRGKPPSRRTALLTSCPFCADKNRFAEELAQLSPGGFTEVWCIVDLVNGDVQPM